MWAQQYPRAIHSTVNIVVPYFFEEEENEDETNEIEKEKLKQVEKKRKLKRKSQREDLGSNPSLPITPGNGVREH